MALTAICAKIISPIFSIKNPEAFQVRTALPIPQPSSLVGALAYSLGVKNNLGLKAMNYVRKHVLAARVSIESPLVILSPMILRRFRVLDKGFERKEKGKKEPYARYLELLSQGLLNEARKIIEVELVDALYREYVIAAKLKCIWILDEEFDSQVLYLIQRIGDTESLCSVVEAWSADCNKIRVDNIETKYLFPHHDYISNIEGAYVYVKMCDEERRLRNFIVPCERKVKTTRKGNKFTAYIPTKVKVSFTHSHEVFSVDNEFIIR